MELDLPMLRRFEALARIFHQRTDFGTRAQKS